MRDFLRVHLPDAVLAEVDLDSLEISKDTYVSSDLRAVFSDLVYRVRITVTLYHLHPFRN